MERRWAPAQPAPLSPLYSPLSLSSVLFSRSSPDTGFSLISGNFGIAPKKYMYILEKKGGAEKRKAEPLFPTAVVML